MDTKLTDAEIRRIIGQPTNAYDTHRPVLAETIIRTTGPILELGMGEGSTPTLSKIAESGRQVWSYEDDWGWYDGYRRFQLVPNHHVLYTSNWDDALCELNWGVALVDHGRMDRRVREIGRLAQTTEIVVVHDTEDERYRYWTIWGLFKYRYDYRKLKPWTTAFSNFIDVSGWAL